MADIERPAAGKQVACEICLKEIPKSAARSTEVEDYVYYFCGLDCYAKWKEQNNKSGN